MYLRQDDGFGAAGLSAPPSGYTPPFNTGGHPVGEDDARHLLTILAGPSPYQKYLAIAMARHATTVPSRFFRIVTNVGSQVPRHLRHLFRSSGNRTVGGTVDRWTRTVYVLPAPGLRDQTRLEYALHECVHLFAHPHVPVQGQCPQLCIGTFQARFGTGFGEGLTQLITEEIMKAQRIRLYYRDRPYAAFTPVVRDVVTAFGLDAVARAYFQGDVDSLQTSMEARWGINWRAVAGATTAGTTDRARRHIEQLEGAYRQRLQQLIRQGPRGDFPTPNRQQSIA
ncbi:MAG: hypothetical protein IT178_09905 [Acidobacteria bacterium]|nr:hypothetical protein [Acidobacteriota bacterium]